MNIVELKLSDVRLNEKNKIYNEENIIELANSIRKSGQMENATVYVDESKNDGKKYTLIGGHRRFLAISYLAERGLVENPVILANIISKPQEDIEESMLIITDNQQRIKDKETLLREIKKANDYYAHLKQQGKKPKGLKRDWIGKQIGISGRTVADLLQKEKEKRARTSPNASPNAERTYIKRDVMKELKIARRCLLKAHELSLNVDSISESQQQLIKAIYESVESVISNFE